MESQLNENIVNPLNSANIDLEIKQLNARVADLRLQKELAFRVKPDHQKRKKLNSKQLARYVPQSILRSKHEIPAHLKEKWAFEADLVDIPTHLTEFMDSKWEIPLTKTNFSRLLTFIKDKLPDLTLNQAIFLHNYSVRGTSTEGFPMNVSITPMKLNYGTYHQVEQNDSLLAESALLLSKLETPELRPYFNHQTITDTVIYLFTKLTDMMVYTDSWFEAYQLLYKELCVRTPKGIILYPSTQTLDMYGVLIFQKFLKIYGLTERTYKSLQISQQRTKLRKTDFDLEGCLHEPQDSIPRISKSSNNEFWDTVYHLSLRTSVVKHFLFNMGISSKAIAYTRDIQYVAALAIYRYKVDRINVQETSCDDCENPFCDGDCEEVDTPGFRRRFQQACAGAKDWCKEQVKFVPTEFKELCKSMKNQFDELIIFFKGMKDKIESTLDPILTAFGCKGQTSLEKIDALINILKAYIISINTESRTIKIICAVLIINELQVGQDIIGAIREWLASSPEEEIDPNDRTPNVTETMNTDDIYDFLVNKINSLLSLDPITVGSAIAFIIFLICGYKCKGSALRGMGTGFVEAMKNMHFIGGGILGFSRAIEVLSKAFKYAAEWIGKTLFNRKPEDEQKAEELKKFVEDYCKWSSEVTVLSSTDLLDTVSSSKQLSQKAMALFEEGMKYNIMAIKGDFKDLPEIGRRHTALFKDCVRLHNTVMRMTGVDNFRVTPFHIQLLGGAGVGKSTMIRSLTNSFKDKFYPDRVDMIYSRGQTDHCDGYRGQPIWFEDDMFPANDYQNVMPLLTMISNCPLHLPMAHLEEKGKMFTSDIMLSTTNTAYPNIDGLFCQEAIWRRRHLLVKTACDPRVLDPAQGKFSPDLFAKHYPGQDSYSYPHLRFTFISPTQEGKILDEVEVPTGLKKPLRDLTYSEFLERLSSRFVQHRKEEEEFASSSENARLKRIRHLLKEFDEVYQNLDCANAEFYEINFDVAFNPLPSPRPKMEDVSRFEDILQHDMLNFDRLVRCATVEDIDLGAFALDCTVSAKKLASTRVITGPTELAVYLKKIAMLYTLANSQENHEHGLYDALPQLLQNIMRSLSTVSIRLNGILSSEDSTLSRTTICKLLKHYLNEVDENDSNNVEDLDFNIVGLAYLIGYPNLYTENCPGFDLPRLLTVMEQIRTRTLYSRYITDATETNGEQSGESLPNSSGSSSQLSTEKRTRCRQPFVPTDWDIQRITKEISVVEDRLIDSVNSLHSMQLPIGKKSEKKLYDMIQALSIDSSVADLMSIIAHISTCGELLMTKEIIELCDGMIYDVKYSLALNSERVEKGKRQAYRDKKIGTPIPFGQNIMEADLIPFSKRTVFETYLYTNRACSGIPAGVRDTPIVMPDDGSCKFVLNEKELREVFQDQYTDSSEIAIHVFTAMNLAVDSDGNWCLKNPRNLPALCTDEVVKHGDFYEKRDYAVKLSQFQAIRNDIVTLANLTEPQRQRLLLLLNRLGVVYTLMRTIKRQVKNKFSGLFTNIWDSITGALSYVWEKLKKWKTALLIGLGAVTVIGACTAFARLFIPEETSLKLNKTFGRLPKSAPRFTSGDNIPRALKDGVMKCFINHKTFQGFRIAPKCLIVPYHVVFGSDDTEDWFPLTFESNPGSYLSIAVERQNVLRIGESDLCLIHHRDLPQWRDLSKYLKTNADLELEAGSTVTHLSKEECELKVVTTPYKGRQINMLVRYKSGLKMTHPNLAVMEGELSQGTSGGILLNYQPNSANRIVVGFQSFVWGGHSYASILTKETWEGVYRQIANSYVKLEGPIDCVTDAEPTDRVVEDLGPQLTVIGRVVAGREAHQPVKSEICRSPIYGVFESKRIPCILSRNDPRSCGDPIKHSINKYGRDTMNVLEPRIQRQVVFERSIQIRDLIDRPPRVLSTTEAIEGNELMPHINLKTSPGVPWLHMKRSKPGKKMWIEIDEDGKLSWMDPVLIQSLTHFESKMREGVVPPNNMVEFLKDELREIGKALGLTPGQVQEYYYGDIPVENWPQDRPVKTRSITMMNFVFGILYRKYIGDLFCLIQQKANGINEHCVGINLESPSAFNMWARAFELGGQGFDFDVGNWDGHFPPWLFNMVLEVIENQFPNSTQEERNIRRSIVECTLFGFIQYRDVVFQKIWGIPSGFPGTADFNTEGHVLIAGAIWILIMEENGLFDLANLGAKHSMVLDNIYGDDRRVIPHHSLLGVFNGESCAAYYEKFGWPITSAAKDGNTNFTRPVEDLQFLKRKLIPDSQDPFYVHPAIDQETIENLCTYLRSSPEPRTQFYNNLNQALDYAADWGREYYEELLSKLNGALACRHHSLITTSYDSMRMVKYARYYGIKLSVEQANELRASGTDSRKLIHPHELVRRHREMSKRGLARTALCNVGPMQIDIHPDCDNTPSLTNDDQCMTPEYEVVIASGHPANEPAALA